MEKTERQSARRIIKVLQNRGVKRNKDGRLIWLVEPFNKSPWTQTDLKRGLIYALDQDWIRGNGERITRLL